MRVLSAVLLALVWSGAFVATHVPKTPGMGGVSDKLLHSTGFIVLACTLGLFLAVRRSFAFRWLAVMMGVLALYAAFDEWTQSFVVNRHADVRDGLADLLGAAIGTAITGCLWWLWSVRAAKDTNRHFDSRDH